MKVPVEGRKVQAIVLVRGFIAIGEEDMDRPAVRRVLAVMFDAILAGKMTDDRCAALRRMIEREPSATEDPGHKTKIPTYPSDSI